MRILLPKIYIDTIQLRVDNVPLFFLAGPVRGGGDWQIEMCEALKRVVPGFIAAIPCRWQPYDPLANYFIPGKNGPGRQLDWERVYMEYAAWAPAPGCLIFWLGEQRQPRSAKEGPYAQDTYGEIGRWVTHKKYRPETRLIVGAEKSFPGLDGIHRNMEMDLGHPVSLYSSMEKTAAAAYKQATGS